MLSISDDVVAVYVSCDLRAQDALQQFATNACQGNGSVVSCLAPGSLLEDELDQRVFPLLGDLACY